MGVVSLGDFLFDGFDDSFDEEVGFRDGEANQRVCCDELSFQIGEGADAVIF